MEIETIVLNAAYISYVVAGLFNRNLLLRIGLVIQSMCFLTWGLLVGSNTSVVWNTIFTSINVVQAIRVSRSSTVRLTDEEDDVRTTHFAGLSRHDFLLMWSVGRNTVRPVGEQLCAEGKTVSDLLLLLDGEIGVTNDAGLNRKRGAGSFVGEISFLSGEPASADVVAVTPIRFRRWNQDDLHNLRELNPRVTAALHQALGRDMGHKLRS